MSDEKHEETYPEHRADVPLEWRDYVAVTIATLQTALLPFVIFMIVLVALLYVLKR